MIKCKYEDGKKANLRHVTVDALIERDGQILFIQRNPDYFIEPGKFALPGGFLDRDESCDEAVSREVLEETGFTTTSTKLFRIIHAPRLKGDTRQNVAFFYIVAIGRQIQKPDYEVHSLHWFDKDKLPDKSKIGFDHADTLDLFLQYQKKPFALPLITG